MLEFEVCRSDMMQSAVEGSNIYYRRHNEECDSEYFIKVQELDGSPMVEALVATLLGYVDNLPKQRYMDYELCKVKDTEYGQECIGVCCQYVSGTFVPITYFCGKHKDMFGDWEDDYYDFSDFMNEVPNGIALQKRYLETVLECIKIETGFGDKEIVDYFLKQALVDTIVKNGARRLRQHTMLLNEDTGKYSFGPMYDFGNSLKPTKGSMAEYPFGDFVEKYVAGDKNKLLRIRAKDFIDDYKDFVDKDYCMTGWFNLNFNALVARLRETKGVLWLES